MALVDVHAHLVPDALVEALGRRSAPPCLERHGGAVFVNGGDDMVFPLFDALRDTDVHRERADRQGIEHTVLSVPPPCVQGLPDPDAVVVARACNDELAQRAASSESRFGAVALLPLQAPDAAVEELRRSAQLGFRGATLLSNVDGVPLDDRRFEPLFAEASALDVTLVLHPAPPAERRAVADLGLLTTLGFVFDTTVCVARLVLTGLYERHPDLRLLMPHAGATIPFLLERFDYELEMLGLSGQLAAPPSEQLRRLYVDSVAASSAALRLALDVFGADRVLFGTDEPFWSGDRAIAILDGAGLEPPAREAVARSNALRLLGPRVASAGGA